MITMGKRRADLQDYPPTMNAKKLVNLSIIQKKKLELTIIV